MDGIILTALEQILSAPIIVEPIRLTRESVAYKFADPEIESLSPLQKQLVRSGPENTKRIQKQALLLKNALLDPSGTSWGQRNTNTFAITFLEASRQSALDIFRHDLRKTWRKPRQIQKITSGQHLH